MKILATIIIVIALNLLVILLNHFLGEVTVKGIVIMLTIELVVAIFVAILYYGSET